LSTTHELERQSEVKEQQMNYLMRNGMTLGATAGAILAAVLWTTTSRADEHLTDEAPKAGELWSWLQEVRYENWAPYPGQDGEMYEGTRPHGALLKVYVNRPAAGHPDEPPHGSVIIKENYSADKELAAITVMKRVRDYDAEHDDWYWVKYTPKGEVAENGKAAGKVQSCIACHEAAGGDDYIFSNDET
jgi:hypothetical protein